MSRLEQMAYKMQPAGHEAPQDRRKYQKPNKKLQKAFDEWAKAVHYRVAIVQIPPYTVAREKAAEVTKGLRCTADEAQGLFLANLDAFPAIVMYGYFLSALYNQMPDKTIVYDLKTKLDHVGHRLKKEKTLVNVGASDNFGEDSQGTIINHGKVTYIVGAGASGFLINYRYCRQLGGYGTNGEPTGLIINLGKAECVGSGSLGINYGRTFFVETDSKNPGILLNLNPKPVRSLYNKNMWTKLYDRSKCEQMPELMNYLNNLRDKLEQGRLDWKKAINAVKELGENPGEKIRHDIEQILRKYNA